MLILCLQRLRDFAPRTASLLKRIALLPRCLLLTDCPLEIHGRTGEHASRAAYIGEGLSLRYFQKLYRSPLPPASRISLGSLSQAVRDARRSCPVVLVEVNALMAPLLPGQCVLTEGWVRQETGLYGERYLHRARGIERGWGQKVRRQQYEYRLTLSERDLERFHQELYPPYAHERYGDDASIRSFSELKSAVGRGFLLQVWRQDRWVSGLVAGRGGDRVMLLAAGAVSSAAMHQGALSALYFFLFRWARQAGIRTVDFCGSRPHLLDGVFQHKSLWGAEPVADPWHHTKIAFYVDPEAELPEVVTSQLVEDEGGFVSLKEALRGASRRGNQEALPSGTRAGPVIHDLWHSR